LGDNSFRVVYIAYELIAIAAGFGSLKKKLGCFSAHQTFATDRSLHALCLEDPVSTK